MKGSTPVVHIDKNYNDLLVDAGYDREKELREQKAQARREEKKEVDELMSKA